MFGNSRLKVLLVLLTLCTALMAPNSVAQGPWVVTATVDLLPANSGTISPFGAQSVENGASITFTVIANPGYRMLYLYVDGTRVPNADTTYTFTNVTADRTILVKFEVIPHCYSAPDTCYVCRDTLQTPWKLLANMDLGVCDTVRFGEPVSVNFTGPGAIAVGDSFKVPFYIYNSRPVGGLSLGFKHDGAHVRFGKGWEVDANSSIPVAARASQTPTYLSANGDSVLIGWTDFTALSPIPATGTNQAVIVGSLFLVVEAAVAGTIRIDSTFVPPAGGFLLTALNPAPGGSKTLTPKYGPGDASVPVQEVSGPNLPEQYALNQNVPNPFNPSTSIEFAVPRSGNVRIKVFNVLGQKVKTLADEYMKAGYKRVEWDGTDQSGNSVASGVYLYRMSANDFGETKKMLLLK